MTALDQRSPCAVCGQHATETIQPGRRTLVRGLDPSDQSYSVTVILPDVPLCDAHAEDVRQGHVLVGWCDDERCRTYGEVGQSSGCGEQFKKLDRTHRS